MIGLWRLWDRFVFRPASPRGPRAVRGILSAYALWLVLSRPDLPEVLGWPPEMWHSVRPTTLTRYLLFLIPLPGELVLYRVLPLLLCACLAGLWARPAAFLSALLLYHFAPLQNVLYSRLGPYFEGFTLPILGLFVLAFAPAPRSDGASSPDHRWPVVLIQILFSFNYVFSAIAKLQSAGAGWVSSENMREMLSVVLTSQPVEPQMARWLMERPLACALMAYGAIAVDLLFVLVPFSRAAAAVLVPAAAIGHVGIALALNIYFVSVPCLLLYVDWDRGLAHRSGDAPG